MLSNILYMKGRYPYPVETIRHWYVAPIGGLSNDLEPGQVGLNREALVDNTDLVPFADKVLISRLDEDCARPLFMKRFFEVVALDKKSLDALSKSPNGEVVLPMEDKGEAASVSHPFMVGELVILNGVLSQRSPRRIRQG